MVADKVGVGGRTVNTAAEVAVPPEVTTTIGAENAPIGMVLSVMEVEALGYTKESTHERPGGTLTVWCGRTDAYAG